MLSNFRRTTGAMSTIPGTPRTAASAAAGAVHGLSGLSMTALNVNGQLNDVEGSFQNFLSLPQMENHNMEVGGEGENASNGMGATGFTGTEGDGGLWGMMGFEGFDWPTELSPSSLPVWLQDGVGVFIFVMVWLVLTTKRRMPQILAYQSMGQTPSSYLSSTSYIFGFTIDI